MEQIFVNCKIGEKYEHSLNVKNITETIKLLMFPKKLRIFVFIRLSKSNLYIYIYMRFN